MEREWPGRIADPEREPLLRQMIDRGLAWLAAHSGVDLNFCEFKGIFGYVVPLNDDSRALMQYICVEDRLPGGVLHHAAIRHVLFIYRYGWDAWVSEVAHAVTGPGGPTVVKP